MSGWRRYLSLPAEGLSLLRRGLGLLCLLDSAHRLLGAEFLLSDHGVLPRHLYFSLFESSGFWSLYLISGRTSFVVLLLLLTAGLGALQLAGRSRRAWRLALYLLVLSVHHRHPALVDSADDLLRMMLFWDVFLPEQPEQAVVTPATVGLQVQLSAALVQVAWHNGPEAMRLAAQWGGGDWSMALAHFPLLERAALLALAAALWLAPLRRPALLLGGVAVLSRAVLLHPAFPLVMAVACSCMAARGREPAPVRWSGSRSSWLGAATVLALVLSLPLVREPALRLPLVRMAQFSGLLQNWGAVYPLARESVTELLARDGEQGAVFWSLSRSDGRRMRLLADKIGSQPVWASALAGALRPGGVPPVVWMRTARLRPDFALGLEEVRLLSLTPVSSLTWRRVR